MIKKDTLVKKQIIINHRYINMMIELSEDKVVNKGILDISFITQALNGEFRSKPLQVNLELENSNIMGHLKYLKAQFSSDDIVSAAILETSIPGFINGKSLTFDYDPDKLDDLNRHFVSMSYITTDFEVSTIELPLDIFNGFVDVFVKILEEKGILDESKDMEEKEKKDGDESIYSTDRKNENVDVESK